MRGRAGLVRGRPGGGLAAVVSPLGPRPHDAHPTRIRRARSLGYVERGDFGPRVDPDALERWCSDCGDTCDDVDEDCEEVGRQGVETDCADA